MARPNKSLMTGSLEEKAMLVKLSLGRWTARKKDTTASNKTELEFGVEHGMTQATKALAKKDALKTVNSKMDYAYNYYITHTLPWTDDGFRILSSAMYTEFMSVMRALKADVADAVKNVAKDYETIKQEALVALGGRKEDGGLYDDRDYPTEIECKYKFETMIMPIPNKQDFRVTHISDEALAEIEKQIEDRFNNAEKNAMSDLYDRIKVVISKVYEAFNDPNADFKDSKIDNVTELMEMVPKLNIAGDANLDKMRKVIETKICTLSAKELRSDINARKNAAEEARAILAQMEEYC